MIQVQQNLSVDSAKNIFVLVYRDDEKDKLSEERIRLVPRLNIYRATDPGRNVLSSRISILINETTWESRMDFHAMSFT
jgi:hypothetical protein